MKFLKKRIISRDDGKPYLIRHNLFECKHFSIKIHKILLSDFDCPHDHPWAFFSIILHGGYIEHRYNDKGFVKSKIYHPFNMLYRKALDRHRLEIHQPCYTFVITFKRTRIWGFWNLTKFIPFYKYNSTQTCE